MEWGFEVYQYLKSGDPIAEFGIDAEFQDLNYTYTQMGMSVFPPNLRRMRQIIALDPTSVNAPCRWLYDDDETPNPDSNPLYRILTTYVGPPGGLELRATAISLLLLHGADVTLSTGKRVRPVYRNGDWVNVDVIAMALEKANEFRAKLRAIFWVTQQIPACRDLGEALVQRVYMSTLSTAY
jgi:hypothetical protein